MATQDPIASAFAAGPWWLRVIYFVGIPAGIALFLVWFTTSTVALGMTQVLDNQQKIMSREQHIDQQMDTAMTNMHDFVKDTQEQNRRILKVWQQICVNGAHSPDAINKCLE
jgi:type III secretory pathway component EscR